MSVRSRLAVGARQRSRLTGDDRDWQSNCSNPFHDVSSAVVNQILITCCPMNIKESPSQPAEAPLALLERSLIDEYVRMHGHDPARLGELVAAGRAARLKGAP